MIITTDRVVFAVNEARQKALQNVGYNNRNSLVYKSILIGIEQLTLQLAIELSSVDENFDYKSFKKACGF